MKQAPKKPKSEWDSSDDRPRDSLTVFERERREKPLLYRSDGKPLYERPKRVGFKP